MIEETKAISEAKEDSKKEKVKKEKKQKPILTEEQIKKKKAKKSRLAVASFVFLLAVGVVGNWYYQNSDLSASIEPLINSSENKTLGEAEYVAATTESVTENKYFSSARLDRQTARDESLEKLQNVIDSTDENSDAKKTASEEIAKISNYINIENKIETLVTSKGINNCLAVINTDGSKVDVIVDCDDLTDDLILQIKEIAIQQLGCSFENVSIIQSK